MTTPKTILPTSLVCYLMLRTDLPSLGRGKGYAHAMHAGNQLTYQMLVSPLMEGKEINQNILNWHREGAGFGTTIALGREGEIDLGMLERVTEGAQKLGIAAGLVIDPDYPYYVDAELVPLIHHDVHTKEPTPAGKGFICYRRETTAGWVIGSKDEISFFMSRFGLAPND